jgi:hypothetical protein
MHVGGRLQNILGFRFLCNMKPLEGVSKGIALFFKDSLAAL